MPTKIPWASETWNVVTGCTPISEGCAHCYAKKMASRLAGRFGYDKDKPFKPTFHADKLEEPLGWHMPRKIFVSSMGDLFHEDVPMKWISEVMGFIAGSEVQRHTFMVLTKRPERMRDYFNELDIPPNLWVGVTAENQERADERIPVLLEIQAAVRFVSIEPMLGDIDITHYGYGIPDWIICGAESGPGARYMDPLWARNLMGNCTYLDIPFFMKQMSNKEPIPEDLMVREWPDVNG